MTGAQETPFPFSLLPVCGTILPHDVITTRIIADFDCLGAMVAAWKLYPDALKLFHGSQDKYFDGAHKAQALLGLWRPLD